MKSARIEEYYDPWAEKHKFLGEDPFLQMSPYGSQVPISFPDSVPHF